MIILKFVRVSIKMTPELEQKLLNAKQKERRYKSEIVRTALKQFFKNPPLPQEVPYMRAERPGTVYVERCFTITEELLREIDNYALNSGYPPLTRSDIIRYALEKYLSQ